MRDGKRGWSLLEVLVVLALSSVFLLIVSRTFAATMRASQHETARATAQGVLMTSLSSLERTMQRSTKSGITWNSGPPALLVIHPQPEGEVTQNPLWEGFWVTYLWQGSDLWMGQLPGAPTQRATLPNAAILAQMQLAPTVGSRRLAQQVSQFDYQVSSGPLFTVTLELSVIPPGRVTPEKFRAVRKIFLHVH